MNSPILPAYDFSATPSPSHTDVDDDALVAELSTFAPAPHIEATRGGPPEEVLDLIATAARIEEELRASGRYVRFHSSADGEHARIELEDREDGTVSALSLLEAFEIAAGNSLV